MGKYRIAEDGRCYEMIYFGDLEQFDSFLSGHFGNSVLDGLYGRGLLEGQAVITMAYCPEINSFAGRENIQIVMQHYC